MASFLPLVLLLLFQIHTSLSSTTQRHSSKDDVIASMKLSTISAAPAVLPGPPSEDDTSSPALSPDIAPLFPSPAKEPLSPEESSSLPTIPSSLSPPNPDAVIAPGPGMAFPPFSGSLKSAARLHGCATWTVFSVVLLVMWIGFGF